MHKRLGLDPENLKLYMHHKWVEYAATMNYRDERVSLEVNLYQRYRVIVGGVIQHVGDNLETAVTFFNDRA